MITLIAKIKAKPEKEADMEKALTGLVKKVETEDGTLVYILNRSLNNPQTFLVYEIYKDKDALAQHSTTPWFKETMKTISPYLDGNPEIETYAEVSRINKN